jgi:hypothetical protein
LVVQVNAWEEVNEELYQKELGSSADRRRIVRSFDQPQRSIGILLMKVWLGPLLVTGAFVLVTFVTVCAVRNREIVAERVSSGISQAVAKEDQKFLDGLFQNQSQESQRQVDATRAPVPKTEFAMNSETVRRAELVVNSGIVKRGELVQPQRKFP